MESTASNTIALSEECENYAYKLKKLEKAVETSHKQMSFIKSLMICSPPKTSAKNNSEFSPTSIDE